MIIDGMSNILNEFDFTDSIIVNLSTSDYSTKLSMTIDYYWDIQLGHSSTRLLVLEFDKCYKIETVFTDEILHNLDKSGYRNSFFTIVKIDKISETEVAFYNNFNSTYFLKVKFATVKIYEKSVV